MCLSGDILGILLDLGRKEVIFSLNGNCLPPFKHLFRHATYVQVFSVDDDNFCVLSALSAVVYSC